MHDPTMMADKFHGIKENAVDDFALRQVMRHWYRVCLAPFCL